MIYTVDEIKHLHLELSSRCNAACPLCPRNFYGYPHNSGYTEHDMSLREVQHIFPKSFVQQLDYILLNGNLGDALMNADTVPIVEYFRSTNPNVNIMMSTNGGARDSIFWTRLAELDVQIFFCLDGLADTHSLYRQNTLFSTVIRNAQTVINAGGRAVWKMIVFDHNRHQINQARAMSQELGFDFFYIENKRAQQNAPVFDSKGQLTHTIGQPTTTNFDRLYRNKLQLPLVTGTLKEPISCQVKQSRSIFVSSVGDVYPCCHIGFSPKTFISSANIQLKELVTKNNALKYDLHTCIEWFNQVEESWKQPTFAQGRLKVCNDACGLDT